MKDKLIFNINSRIEIADEDGMYKSTIQDLDGDNIIINIPVKDGRYLVLHTGQNVEAIYQINDDIYKFSTKVLGRKIDQINVLILGEPQNIKKVQRRNHVRLSMLLDIECALINKNTNLVDNNQFKFFKATLLDISGGGMKIAYNDKLNKNDLLITTIPIGNEALTLKAKVVRIDTDSKEINKYALSFYDIEEKEREKIMKFIFEIMRKQRKKLLTKGE